MPRGLTETLKNTGSGTPNVKAFQSLQWGEVSVARPVGGESQAKPVSGSAKRADRRGDPVNCGHGDLRLTREGSWNSLLQFDRNQVHWRLPRVHP